GLGLSGAPPQADRNMIASPYAAAAAIAVLRTDRPRAHDRLRSGKFPPVGHWVAISWARFHPRFFFGEYPNGQGKLLRVRAVEEQLISSVGRSLARAHVRRLDLHLICHFQRTLRCEPEPQLFRIGQ